MTSCTIEACVSTAQACAAQKAGIWTTPLVDLATTGGGVLIRPLGESINAGPSSSPPLLSSVQTIILLTDTAHSITSHTHTKLVSTRFCWLYGGDIGPGATDEDGNSVCGRPCPSTYRLFAGPDSDPLGPGHGLRRRFKVPTVGPQTALYTRSSVDTAAGDMRSSWQRATQAYLSSLPDPKSVNASSHDDTLRQVSSSHRPSRTMY